MEYKDRQENENIVWVEFQEKKSNTSVRILKIKGFLRVLDAELRPHVP